MKIKEFVISTQAALRVVKNFKVLKASRLFSSIGMVFILWAAPSHGGPPLLTDDPDTPGPNHWEINTGMTANYAAHVWEIGAPLLDMNYGVGERIQLKYQVQYNVLVPQNGGARSGMGDSLAGIKWRFLDQTNWSWLEVSTYPQIEFIYPSSSIRRGLGDAGDNLLLPLEFEHQFKSLTLYMEGGYILNEYQTPEGWYGLAGEYELSEKFSLMGEIYGGWDRAFQHTGGSFNIGFRRPLTEHVALIGSAGRGIFGSPDRSPAFQSYLALQLTL